MLIHTPKFHQSFPGFAFKQTAEILRVFESERKGYLIDRKRGCQ